MPRRESYAKYEKRMKPFMDEGHAHAQAGGDAKGIDKYHGISERNAWLVGWRNGGGDIRTGQSKHSTRTPPHE